MRTFFIADTHFGDADIIRYENRPFADVADMEEKLTARWNETVNPEDRVFVLGDFSEYRSIEQNAGLVRRLNGHKSLILGNHDIADEEFWRSCGFDFVSRYPIIYEGFWILSHEPLYVCRNMPYANVFGHVHDSPLYKDYSEQSFCVSVERTDYRPVLFEQIVEKVTNNRKQKEEKA